MKKSIKALIALSLVLCSAMVFSGTTYTYKHIPSNVGDIITVGGLDYIMVGIPWAPKNGRNRYVIVHPVPLGVVEGFEFGYAAYDTQNVPAYISAKNTLLYNSKFDSLRGGGEQLVTIGFDVENVGEYSDLHLYSHTELNLRIINGNNAFILRSKLDCDAKTIQTPANTTDFSPYMDWDFNQSCRPFMANLRTLTNYMTIKLLD
jgi:hypothetical protein